MCEVSQINAPHQTHLHRNFLLPTRTYGQVFQKDIYDEVEKNNTNLCISQTLLHIGCNCRYSVQEPTRTNAVVSHPYLVSHMYRCLTLQNAYANLRTLLELAVKWVTNSSLLCSFNRPFNKLVVNFFLYEYARTSTATLALIEEQSKMTLFHGVVHCNEQSIISYQLKYKLYF